MFWKSRNEQNKSRYTLYKSKYERKYMPLPSCYLLSDSFDLNLLLLAKTCFLSLVIVHLVIFYCKHLCFCGKKGFYTKNGGHRQSFKGSNCGCTPKTQTCKQEYASARHKELFWNLLPTDRQTNRPTTNLSLDASLPKHKNVKKQGGTSIGCKESN